MGNDTNNADAVELRAATPHTPQIPNAEILAGADPHSPGSVALYLHQTSASPTYQKWDQWFSVHVPKFGTGRSPLAVLGKDEAEQLIDSLYAAGVRPTARAAAIDQFLRPTSLGTGPERLAVEHRRGRSSWQLEREIESLRLQVLGLAQLVTGRGVGSC